jgi:hypothetical protein
MDINLWGAINAQYHKQGLDVRISDGYTDGQIAIVLEQGQDKATLFLNREQFDLLFGKMNTYLESVTAPERTINDIAKEMAESEAPYSLC